MRRLGTTKASQRARDNPRRATTARGRRRQAVAATAARHDADDVLPEVDQPCGLRAQLGARGERSTWVVSGEEKLADDQLVRARADRQELGETLHDAQHDRLKPTHTCSSSVQ